MPLKEGYVVKPRTHVLEAARVVTNTEASWRGLTNDQIQEQYPQQADFGVIADARLAEVVAQKQTEIQQKQTSGEDIRVLTKQLNYLREIQRALPRAR